MGKTSDIWKYFSKSNSENSAKCLICDKNLACNKGSTKGLWDHFKLCMKRNIVNL
uniref:BED-type domain-containing protein n=1 Tax=Meloidogyne incognita TaxID=6306 RepID=A0A914LUR0_MELIC